jgi:hypothetical protein
MATHDQHPCTIRKTHLIVKNPDCADSNFPHAGSAQEFSVENEETGNRVLSRQTLQLADQVVQTALARNSFDIWKQKQYK